MSVEPGGVVLSDDIDLREAYRLPLGGDVRVRYSIGHPLKGPDRAGGPFEPVHSDWVTLSLSE